MPRTDSARGTASVTVAMAVTAVLAFTALGALGGVAQAQQAAPEVTPSSLPTLHSDIKFSVFAPPRIDTGAGVVPDAAAALKAQVDRVSIGLQGAAHRIYSERMQRLGRFDVFVADSRNAETLSSGSGKIALYGGIAELQAGDEWLAFVIAREMGHVIAGHHDDNSAASIITSVIMNLIVPGSSLLKSAISLASSQTAAAAGAERQVREADDIALRLLEAAGYRLHDIARSLASGPTGETLGMGSWARAFQASASALAAKADTTPVPLTPLTLARVMLPQGIPAVAPGREALPAMAVPALRPAADPAPASARLVLAPLPDLPVARSRPSGVAGPLLLGGFSVPSRRID